MSARGVFAVDRGIFDHPIFAPEPFTEREAWLWMLSAAAWADKRVRVGKAMIDLKRGQLAFATRFIAEKWKWAHSRVVRFLNRLKSDTMVSTLATREATLITICNYDEYQFGRNATETQSGTPTETEVKRARNKEEEANKLITKHSRPISDRPAREPSRFDEFWQAYPRRDGGNPRKPAEQKFNALVKSGCDPEMLIAEAKKLNSAETARGNVGTRFIPMAQTWLGQQRWADHAAVAFLAGEAEMSIEQAVESFAKIGRWSKWAPGPEPGLTGCKASPELLAQYGIAPDGRKLAMAG